VAGGEQRDRDAVPPRPERVELALDRRDGVREERVELDVVYDASCASLACVVAASIGRRSAEPVATAYAVA
jgi:hypothetical protein